MAKVNLDVLNMSILQKLDTANSVVNSLRSNPYFYHYQLPLDRLSAVSRRLENALKEGRNDIQNCDLLNLIELEESLDSLLIQIADEVENISRGNAVLIASAGFDLYRQPPAKHQLRKVETEIKKESGEVDLKWQRVYGAKAYLVEISCDPDNPDSWQKIGHTFRSQYSLFKPERKKQYFIRVSVIDEDHKIIFSKVQALVAA